MRHSSHALFVLEADTLLAFAINSVLFQLRCGKVSFTLCLWQNAHTLAAGAPAAAAFSAWTHCRRCCCAISSTVTGCPSSPELESSFPLLSMRMTKPSASSLVTDRISSTGRPCEARTIFHCLGGRIATSRGRSGDAMAVIAHTSNDMSA